MELNASYVGGCQAPFYDASLFPQEGGYIGGRLCASGETVSGQPTCCLPCPATYWTYPETFTTYNTIAAWLNVAGAALLSFLLISYFFLPIQKTRRHYLSICLIVAILFINLGFIVPLGANPEQCYNAITPNDMYSSMTCAWSGAFIIAGGLCGAAWIFIRVLSMHLQICWDIVPGRKFFYLSQAFGWGLPAALFAATISVTGVSFRFGTSCHVNHEQSMQTFWGWLLAVAAASVIMQLSTFAYCAHVFISNLWSDDQPPSVHISESTGLPRYTASSVRTQTAKAIWRRLKNVLFLQWRGIIIVTITLIDVIFFAVTFVYLDDLETSMTTDFVRLEPWIACLVLSGGDKNKCVYLADKWLIKEGIIGAMLVMLSLIGLEVFCLLFRWSLLTGWTEYFGGKLSAKEEFISLDARSPHARPGSSGAQKYGANGVAFEMQKPKEYNYDDMDMKTMSPVESMLPAMSPTDSITSHGPPHFGPNTPEPGFSDYFGGPKSKPQLSINVPHYKNSVPQRNISNASTAQPDHSFTSSRVPSNDTIQTLGWDPTSSYAASTVASPARLHDLYEGGPYHSSHSGQAI